MQWTLESPLVLQPQRDVSPRRHLGARAAAVWFASRGSDQRIPHAGEAAQGQRHAVGRARQQQQRRQHARCAQGARRHGAWRAPGWLGAALLVLRASAEVGQQKRGSSSCGGSKPWGQQWPVMSRALPAARNAHPTPCIGAAHATYSTPQPPCHHSHPAPPHPPAPTMLRRGPRRLVSRPTPTPHPHAIQVKLAVSRKLCGAVIGQKGGTIREFMADSGATIRVQVTPHPAAAHGAWGRDRSACRHAACWRRNSKAVQGEGAARMLAYASLQRALLSSTPFAPRPALIAPAAAERADAQ